MQLVGRPKNVKDVINNFGCNKMIHVAEIYCILYGIWRVTDMLNMALNYQNDHYKLSVE